MGCAARFGRGSRNDSRRDPWPPTVHFRAHNAAYRLHLDTSCQRHHVSRHYIHLNQRYTGGAGLAGGLDGVATGWQGDHEGGVLAARPLGAERGDGSRGLAASAHRLHFLRACRSAVSFRSSFPDGAFRPRSSGRGRYAFHPSVYADTSTFRRFFHSSSSTTSNRIVFPRMTGTHSLHSLRCASSVQSSKTLRL